MYYKGFHDAFFFVDTYGLPLAIMMDETEKYDLRVALDSFVYDAFCAGWKFEKAINCCWEAIAMMHGPRIADDVAEKLKYGTMKRIAAGILKEWRFNDRIQQTADVVRRTFGNVG